MTAYADADDLKRWANVSSPEDAANFRELVESASRRVDYICRRTFAPPGAAQTRSFELGPDYEDGVSQSVIDDLNATPSLVEVAVRSFGATWDEVPADCYELERPAVAGAPFTGIRLATFFASGGTSGSYYTTLAGHYRRVRITGTWGWSAVPEPVRQATVLIAARLRRLPAAPLGVETVNVPGGETIVQTIERSSPDVAALLAPYQRQAIT